MTVTGHTCLVQCVNYSFFYLRNCHMPNVAHQISLQHPDLTLCRVFLIPRPPTHLLSWTHSPGHLFFSTDIWAHCAHSCLPVSASGNSSSPTPLNSYLWMSQMTRCSSLLHCACVFAAMLCVMQRFYAGMLMSCLIIRVFFLSVLHWAISFVLCVILKLLMAAVELWM